MKLGVLYHGSVREIEGDYFIPKKQQDLDENPDNLHIGVYATKEKAIAIAMAIISCKGVNWASLSFIRKPYGVIYEGWPKQDYIYLYIYCRQKLLENREAVENNMFRLNL